VKGRGPSVAEFAKRIAAAIEKEGWNIFLLIHYIDGPGLRYPIQQEALSILSKQVYIIASSEHVNIGLLWDQKTRDSFRWLFFPISVVRQKQIEPKQALGAHGKETKESTSLHSIASLDAFWNATTKNQHTILEQLAIHAGIVGDKNTENPLMLPRLCRILKEEFATTNETALRNQLVEFADHNLILLGKDNSIQLMVDRHTLVSFLDHKLSD